MYDVEIINPAEYFGWDDLLASNPESTFFHTAEWAKVLAETYDYRPLYFTIRDEKGLIALMPLMEIKSVLTGSRGVSLPFTDYCQAVITDRRKFDSIFDFAREYGRKRNWKFIEIRGGNFSGDAAVNFFYGHKLKLTEDLEQIFSRFEDATRRNIRKAIREGVKVNTHKSIDAVKEFCRLHCITRQKHGLPPQPWTFFKNIYENVISKNLGFVALASYNKKIIAASVFFNFRDKAIYKFGASDSKYQHLRANNLVMWEAIKLFARNGCREFCFGRTEPDNTGLRRFKCGWGAEEKIINYYRYDLRQNAFVSQKPLVGGSHRRFFGNMPLPLLKIFGSLLYKHIG